MRELLSKNLLHLAEISPTPLYIVGGAVRDFLAGHPAKNADFDLSAPINAEAFVSVAKNAGFQVVAVYKNTGTVKLKDDLNKDYEFTSFRSDKYVRGVHTPVEIFFTDDILLDAKRRDFTANAVYYDIQKGEIVDPLHGVDAIREKKLITVDDPEKVFGEDGLRLMRLARQAGQLGFIPEEKTLLGAKNHAKLILDITSERIFAELSLILSADEKYGVKDGHYRALKVLEETLVLDELFPELTLGKGLTQRADFHSHDVLEHSFRACLYARKDVRLAALLHDVGKPYCHFQRGNSYEHPQEGARIAEEILDRLKAPKRLKAEVCKLVELHMYDFDLKTKESKLRRFFVKNYPILDKLLAVKQADFSGCKDDLSICPTAQKWEAVFRKMEEEHAPVTLKQLAVNGKDLLREGYPPTALSELLERLLHHAVVFPKENKKARLLQLARGFFKEISC